MVRTSRFPAPRTRRAPTNHSSDYYTRSPLPTTQWQPSSCPSLSNSSSPSPSSPTDSIFPSDVPLSSCSTSPASSPSPAPKPRKSRSSTSRRVKDPNHIPRPTNPFIVFRSYKFPELIASGVESDHRIISKILGNMWRKMSEQEKAPFVARATQLAEQHKRAYPDYRFCPTRRKEPKVKRKVQRQDALTATRVALIAEIAYKGGDIKQAADEFDSKTRQDPLVGLIKDPSDKYATGFFDANLSPPSPSSDTPPSTSTSPPPSLSSATENPPFSSVQEDLFGFHNLSLEETTLTTQAPLLSPVCPEIAINSTLTAAYPSYLQPQPTPPSAHLPQLYDLLYMDPYPAAPQPPMHMPVQQPGLGLEFQMVPMINDQYYLPDHSLTMQLPAHDWYQVQAYEASNWVQEPMQSNSWTGAY